MKTFPSLVTFSLSALLLAGCQFQFNMSPGVPGSGTIKTESREIETFDSLEFAGSGAIEFAIADTPECTVEVDDNLQELVSTKIDGTTLKIKFLQNIEPTRKLKIVLKSPSLNRCSLAGAAKFTAVDLHGDSFELDLAGACNAEISGKTNKLKLSMAGASDVRAEKLVAEDVNISVAGAGSATTHANQKLDVSVAGTGKVQYLGNPEISQSISGAGSVKRMKND